MVRAAQAVSFFFTDNHLSKNLRLFPRFFAVLQSPLLQFPSLGIFYRDRAAQGIKVRVGMEANHCASVAPY